MKIINYILIPFKTIPNTWDRRRILSSMKIKDYFATLKEYGNLHILTSSLFNLKIL